MDNIVETFRGYGSRLGEILKKEIDPGAMNATKAGGLLAVPLTAAITRKAFLVNPLLGLFAWQRHGTRKFPYRSVTRMAGAVGPVGANAKSPVTSPTFGEDQYAYACERRRRAQIPGAVRRWSEYFGSSERAQPVDMDEQVLNEVIRSQSFDVSASAMHGNHAANQYDCDGVCNFISGSVNRVQAASAATAVPTVPTNPDYLDEALAVASENSDGGIENLYFVMSRRLLDRYSYIDQAGTGKRINFTAPMGIEGGILISSFKGVPILVTDVLGGKKAGTMGTVTPSTATVGGTIPADDYFIYVSAITAYGESLASPEITQTTTGSTSTITLTFAAFDTGAPSYQAAQYYRVYLGTTTGPQNCTPIKEVSAWTYDSEGYPTAAITSITITTIMPDDTVAGRTSDLPRIASALGAPSEDILLADMDPNAQGIGRAFFNHFSGSATEPEFFGMVSAEPLARTDDFDSYLLVSAFAPIPDHPETSTLIRGVAAR